MLHRWVAAVLLLCGLASAASAQKWERLGPEGGMVVSLAAGGGGTVYLGTADGHVFASGDGAANWQLRGRVGHRLDAVVSRLAADAKDRNLVFAAVWYRQAAENGGVFRSEDGGRNWRASGLEGEAVRALEVAPSDPSELVAGTRTGVFRSRDQGATWQRISPDGAPELRNADSIAIDPRDPGVIYAGTYHLPWRTKDGGTSWEPVLAGIIDDSDIMSLRLDSTNPDRVYMSACSGIYRSEHQGSEWTKLQGIPYAARRTHTIVQDLANPKTFYAGTTAGAWATRDSGETWTRTTPKDWVVNSVLVLPAHFPHAGRVVLGTEAGIQVSDNDGETFVGSNRGFTHIVVKQLLASFEGGLRLLALVQRNGWELLQSVDGGRSWLAVPLGEAGINRPALSADQIEEAFGGPWGWVLRMADGTTWVQQEKTNNWREWKPRLGAEPARTTAGVTRKPTGWSPSRLQIRTGPIAFADDFAIAGSPEGVVRCSEAGWCSRLKAFTGNGLTSAVWVSRNGREIAVLQDNQWGLSLDAGDSASWRDLPLAGAQCLWIAQAKSEDSTFVILGTSIGLFFSRDGGARWTPAGNGLPAGRMEQWLSTAGYWLVSERSGGLYFSSQQGVRWARIDEDEERSRFAGLVDLGDGSALVGSQSEGILRVTSSPAVE